jgi:hypothetical protein
VPAGGAQPDTSRLTSDVAIEIRSHDAPCWSTTMISVAIPALVRALLSSAAPRSTLAVHHSKENRNGIQQRRRTLCQQR